MTDREIDLLHRAKERPAFVAQSYDLPDIEVFKGQLEQLEELADLGWIDMAQLSARA